jgi:hypothetical protein
MYYALNNFKTIPKEQLQKLQAVKILDTDILLSFATLPSDREMLGRHTGISTEDITRLASLADLVRVKGIGPRMAETLADSGLAGNVQQFLEIMQAQGKEPKQSAHYRLKENLTIRQTATKVARTLRTYAKSTSNQYFTPSCRQLIEAAEEALELKPRLVLQIQENQAEFRRQVFDQWNDEKKFLRKNNNWWLLVFVVIMLLPTLIFSYIRYQNMTVIPINLMDVKYNQFIYNTNLFLGIDFILFCCIFLLLITIVYSIWRVFSFFASTYLKLLLFNSKTYQKAYTDLKPDTKKEKRASWWVLSLFAVLSLWLIADVARTTANPEVFVGQVLERVFTFGVLFGIVITIPTLLKLINFRRKMISDTAVQRYIIYMIIFMSVLPVILHMAVQTAPITIQVHTRLMESLVLPRFNASVTETRIYIEKYQTENDVEVLSQQYYLFEIEKWNDESGKVIFLLGDPQTSKFIDSLMSSAKQALLGLYAVTVIVLFILPYLIYGGVEKGFSISFSCLSHSFLTISCKHNLPLGSVRNPIH